MKQTKGRKCVMDEPRPPEKDDNSHFSKWPTVFSLTMTMIFP